MLKPSMTTSNRIITYVIDSALFIPLECLHSMNDSISYVFVRRGIKKAKQEIKVGGTNNNEAVVELGLDPGDKVYLSVPAGMDDEPIAMLPELDGTRSPKEEEIVQEVPAERVITLPDGRKITVPAGSRPGDMGEMRGGRPQGQQEQQNFVRGDSLQTTSPGNVPQITDGRNQDQRPRESQAPERSAQNN
jgi:hypothetical protein